MLITIILGLILAFGLAFLINAGLIWVICWGLKAIGITAIFGWEVAFSWPLVIVFTAAYMILHGIFSVNVHKN